MLKLTAAEVLAELARIHGLLHPNDKPNISAMAKRTGIPQPTVSRIMKGGADWEMGTSTISSLCNAFHITFDQAKGEAPLEAHHDVYLPSPTDLELVRDIRSLNGSDQKEIEAIVRLKTSLLQEQDPKRTGKKISKKKKTRK